MSIAAVARPPSRCLLPALVAGLLAGSATVWAAEAAAPPQDPLDRLRERLTEKLGAKRPADMRSTHVLEVASRAPGELLVSAPATGGKIRKGSAQVSAAKGHAAPGAHWSYEGETGPHAWGALKPEFGACATGKRQSPIDIRDGFAVELDPIVFNYRPSGFSVIDNGHTVQVDLPPGQSIEALGRRYELLQFHFHRPSEERIDGRSFEMVMHLVHKDAQGRLAVVALLIERGSAHPLVQAVWNNLPLEKGEPMPASGTLDLNQLLPTDRRHFQYMGSLTTPPCSEGVLWMVMRQPVSVSAEQIGLFARLYPMNARPIQATAGRMIKQSH